MMEEPGRFGSPLRWREASHDVWGWRWLDDLGQDIRYALRSLAAHKAFSTTAIITLALGIGATTAIFSVVSALVFRPLPFAAPERLVQIRGSSPLAPTGDAVNNREAYRREATSFESIVGYEPTPGFSRCSECRRFAAGRSGRTTHPPSPLPARCSGASTLTAIRRRSGRR